MAVITKGDDVAGAVSLDRTISSAGENNTGVQSDETLNAASRNSDSELSAGKLYSLKEFKAVADTNIETNSQIEDATGGTGSSSAKRNTIAGWAIIIAGVAAALLIIRKSRRSRS